MTGVQTCALPICFPVTIRVFDQSRSRDNGGSGLGMSIMSAVIEKLDGKFSLRKSELGGLAIVADLPQL